MGFDRLLRRESYGDLVCGAIVLGTGKVCKARSQWDPKYKGFEVSFWPQVQEMVAKCKVLI